MNKLFLLNEAFIANDINQLIRGCDELVLIEKETDDCFYKHESFYSSQAYIDLCSHACQSSQFLIEFFERDFPNISNYLATESELDVYFQPNHSAFLGIDFSQSTVNPNRRVFDQYTYNVFVEFSLSLVTPNNFWQWKNKLFPNLVLCDSVENQVTRLGQSAHFNQVIDRLRILNGYVQRWDSGGFSYHDLNSTTSLRVSPESESTMKLFGNQRVFALPDGTRETFELHIKTGDLRFHFYPSNRNYIVYIGYIGPHLDI